MTTPADRDAVIARAEQRLNTSHWPEPTDDELLLRVLLRALKAERAAAPTPSLDLTALRGLSARWSAADWGWNNDASSAFSQAADELDALLDAGKPERG